MKLNLKELLGDNYRDGMTIEDVLGMDVDVPDGDGNTKKRLDEVSKESAARKKELRSKDATIEELTETVNALKRENTIGKRTGIFAEMGYGTEQAAAAAEATATLSEEDFEAFVGAQREVFKAQKANNQRKMDDPAPSKPGSGNELTSAMLANMSLDQMQSAYESDPKGFMAATS